jgi:hypothetical protein
VRDRHPIGERALARGLEPQRDTVLADVAVAVSTLTAAAVAEAERDRDAVTRLDTIDPFADLDDGTGGFVAEDLARGWHVVDPLAVSLPGVPVAATDPAGFHIDDDAVGGCGRLLDVPDPQGCPVFFENDCSHMGGRSPTHTNPPAFEPAGAERPVRVPTEDRRSSPAAGSRDSTTGTTGPSSGPCVLVRIRSTLIERFSESV